MNLGSRCWARGRTAQDGCGTHKNSRQVRGKKITSGKLLNQKKKKKRMRDRKKGKKDKPEIMDPRLYDAKRSNTIKKKKKNTSKQYEIQLRENQRVGLEVSRKHGQHGK